MRYRCKGCHRNCTASVPSDTKPVTCLTGEHTAQWVSTQDLPVDDHRSDKGLIAYRKYRNCLPVTVVNVKTGLRLHYESATSAATYLGLDKGNFRKAVRENDIRDGHGRPRLLHREWMPSTALGMNAGWAKGRQMAAAYGYDVFRAYIGMEPDWIKPTHIDDPTYEEMFGAPPDRDECLAVLRGNVTPESLKMMAIMGGFEI